MEDGDAAEAEIRGNLAPWNLKAVSDRSKPGEVGQHFLGAGCQMWHSASLISRRANDVSVNLDSGIPEYSVDAVLVGGQDLLRSKSTFTRMLALYIVEQADSSCWLQEKVNEREGVVYRGLGGNDPDGHFRRSAA
ncbi:hypothetical protein ACHMW7_16065 [Aminobacter sp. UC22_36]